MSKWLPVRRCKVDRKIGQLVVIVDVDASDLRHGRLVEEIEGVGTTYPVRLGKTSRISRR